MQRRVLLHSSFVFQNEENADKMGIKTKITLAISNKMVYNEYAV
jgi:hypothetical protein